MAYTEISNRLEKYIHRRSIKYFRHVKQEKKSRGLNTPKKPSKVYATGYSRCGRPQKQKEKLRLVRYQQSVRSDLLHAVSSTRRDTALVSCAPQKTAGAYPATRLRVLARCAHKRFFTLTYHGRRRQTDWFRSQMRSRR